jgi:hypothetical protein
MDKETSKKVFTMRLLEVQKEINPIKKTETNPFFNSKYFDVNAILEQLKPILTKYGLILTQPFNTVDGKNVLQTIVVDSESGEQMQSQIFIPEVLDPQKFGSAVTYYRRYALQSLFALQAEDDDANKAAGVVNKPTFAPRTATRKPTKFKPQEHDGDESYNIEA